MTTFIALLRAVNVGGRKLPMADLRKLCETELGFGDVQTYIQSGNLVFTATGTPAAIARKLENAIAKGFKMDVPVILRTATEWKAYLNPPKAFAGPAKDEPNRVALGLAQGTPKPGAAKELEAKGKTGERVLLVGDALWFHYPEGMGRSELTPARIDKAAGSPVTSRNLNTVRKLAEMAGLRDDPLG